MAQWRADTFQVPKKVRRPDGQGIRLDYPCWGLFRFPDDEDNRKGELGDAGVVARIQQKKSLRDIGDAQDKDVADRLRSERWVGKVVFMKNGCVNELERDSRNSDEEHEPIDKRGLFTRLKELRIPEENPRQR